MKGGVFMEKEEVLSSYIDFLEDFIISHSKDNVLRFYIDTLENFIISNVNVCCLDSLHFKFLLHYTKEK